MRRYGYGANKRQAFIQADYIDCSCKRNEKLRWIAEAQRRGMSLSEFISESCNANCQEQES